MRTDIKLNILHDHYKESFLYIRDREKQRDRLFLFIIALIGILFLEIQYAEIFPNIFKSINLESFNLNLSTIPIFVFLSITWTYLFVLILKYCQIAIGIEKQYEYLHILEKKISNIFNDKEIYSREGRAYLKNYPIFSEFAWIFYVLIFPIIAILSTALLLYFEWNMENTVCYHLIYDSLLVLGVAFSFILYRIWSFVITIYQATKKKVFRSK